MVRRTRIAFGFAALALAIAPASAANWNGFYIGLHAGGATGDVDWANVSNTTPLAGTRELDFILGDTIAQSPDGVLGGAQIGFNFQMTNWVFGLELDGSGMDFDETSLNPNSADVEAVSSEIEWLGTAAARVGFSSMDSLFYLKGGYATGSIVTEHVDASGGDANAYSTDETHHGWVAGAGFEHMIGSNVSVGLEYNYIDLGNTDHTGTASPGVVVNDMDAQIHSVTARLNVNLYTP
jgi:outer membrane immunogenic protein